MSKWHLMRARADLGMVFIACVAAYSPLFVYFITGDYNKEIESSYVNGLVSASGILLGFLTAAAISRSNQLSSFICDLIDVSFASFGLAIIFFTTAIIEDNLKVFEITLILANIMLSLISTYVILRKMFSGTRA